MKLLPVLENKRLFIFPKLRLFVNSECTHNDVIYTH
jgi:hypothetical protein